MIKNKKNIPHQFRNELFISNNNKSVGVASVGSGGVANADLDNYLKLSGATSQVIYSCVGFSTTPSHRLTIGGSQSKSGSFENLLSINSNDSANQLRLKFGLDNNWLATSRGAVIEVVEEGVDYRNLILNPTAGNVGIGTTSPTAKLHVNGNISTTSPSGKIGFNVGDAYGDYAHYGISKSAGSNPVNLAGYFGLSFGTLGLDRMFINTSGNVGIGTTTPNKKLEVKTPHAVNIDDEIRIGSYYNNSFFGIGLNYQIDSVGQPYQHLVTYDFGTKTTNLTLSANGSVGIGTSSPNSNGGASARVLHLNSDNNSWSVLHVTNSTTGKNAADGTLFGMIDYDAYVFNYENANLIFGSNSAERMRIDNNGSVGIGTTTPTRPLHVVGATPLRLERIGVEKYEFGISNNGTSDILMITSVDESRTLTTFSSNGDVGIGTNSPTSKLHIYDFKTTENSQIILQDVGNWGNQQLHNIQWNDSISKVGAIGLKYSGADGTVDFQIHSLYNNGYVNSSDVKFVVKGNGNVVIGNNLQVGGEITFNYTSDERLKENVKPINNAVSIINRLNPVSYNWNEQAIKLNANKNRTDNNFGLIAQELEQIMPEMVHKIYNNQYKSIDYIQLIPILIKAIQEQQTEINELKSKLS